MTKSEKERYTSKLFNQLSLAFKAELYNQNVKDIFLLLNSLPIYFDFIEVDKKSKLLSKNGIFGGLASFNNKEKTYEITIKIYNSLELESWEECINYIIASTSFEKISKKLSFVYLHEMLHIFQKHLINYQRYIDIVNNLLKENNNDIDKNLKLQELLNIAFDYHINSVIYNTGLFNDLYKDETKIDFLFNNNYNSENMSELDILKDLIQNSKIEKTVFENLSLIKLKITPKGEDTKEIIIDIDINNNNNEILDNIKNQNQALNIAKSKAKGNGSSKIMQSLGLPIEVEISWIDKLKTKINNITFKFSKKKRKSWSKLNIFYKNTNLPGTKLINDNKEVFVIIDYSSSMTNSIIQKINYVLLKLNEKKFNLNIIGHTTKIEKIEKIDFKSKKIKEFIKYRHCTGGTSHQEVFNYLEENIDGKMNLIIILSDMESDIESIYNDYTFPLKSQIVYVDTSLNNNLKFYNFSQKTNNVYIHI